MEPDQLQTSEPPSFMKGKGIKIVLGISVFFLIILTIGLFAFLSARSSTDNPSSGIQLPVTVVTPFAISDPADPEVQKVQEENGLINESIQTNRINDAVSQFSDVEENQSRKDAISRFLQEEQQLLSQDGLYDPEVKDIQVAGDRAQVLLEDELNNKKVLIRRDLIRVDGEWKVEDVKYNKFLDLQDQQEAQGLEDELTSGAQLENLPTTHTLPNGDTLHVFRTNWKSDAPQYYDVATYDDTVFNEISLYDFGTDREFLYQIPDPRQTYTVVVFDAPYPISPNVIQAGSNEGNYGSYHSFDIHLIEGDIKRAVLLVYEGNVAIDTETIGVPPGWIFAVPFGIDITLEEESE